jgi:phosphatidate cytidylyltransferase
MAPPAERPSSNGAGGLTNLQKRILSAAVLLPLVIAAIYLGHPYFTVLIVVFAGVAAWEWARVAGNPRTGAIMPVPSNQDSQWASIAATSAMVIMSAMLLVGSPTVWPVILCVVVGLTWLALALYSREWRRIAWTVPGVIYVAVAGASLLLIRSDPEHGLAALLWIIALVVAADTGGYLVGRTVGGPKLVPRISPNKTWSGLGGAVAGAALVGFCTAFILNHTNVLMLTLISAVIGLLEQGGDLVESAFKRHFGVKDTSQIIPGHGGVLDRVDGLLAVAVAVLVINLWAGGSVLAW